MKLDWRTISENNNNYFIVERSIDGVNFEQLHKINGIGNSNWLNLYEYNDINPGIEITYYRLKQIDINGQYKYSNVISVDEDNSKAFIGNVYPNPTSSTVGFEFYAPIKGTLKYDITDITGRILMSQIQFVESGHSKWDAQIDELPSGIYLLKITFEKTNLSSTYKVFKN